MRDLLRKYHKYLVTFGIAILLMMIGSLYSLVKYSLPQTVRTILQATLGADLESQSIIFKKGGIIEIRDVTLKDGQELIVDAPLVEISYRVSRIVRGRIDEIKVINPEVWLTRDVDNNINIVDVFKGDDDDDDGDDDDSEDYPYINEGSEVPIDRITIVDGYLYYKDTAYDEVIEKEASDVNGWVTFDKKTGIALSFAGMGNGIRGREKLAFSFNDEFHPYEIGVKLENVSINDNLMQYAYKDETISYRDGVVNFLDLTMTPDIFRGSGDFSELFINYEGLETDVTEGAGKVNFAGERIYVDGNYLFGEEPGSIAIEYKGEEGVDIDLHLEDILFEKLEAYDMLGELELPIGDMLFNSVHIALVFDELGDLKMDLDFDAPYYNAGKMEIKELFGTLYYEGGENFYLKDVEFKGEYEDQYIPLDFFAHIDARLTEDEGELSYRLSDIESDTNIDAINGEAQLDFVRKIFNLEVDSKLLTLTANLNLEDELFTLKQDSKEDIEVYIRDKKIINKSKIHLVYDLKEKSFLIGEGDIDLGYENSSIKGKISTLRDNVKLEDLRYLDDTGSFLVEGEVNLRDMSYNIDFSTNELDLSKFLIQEGLDIVVNLDGNVEGKGEKFEGNIDVDNVSGKYFLEFNNLEGDIYVKNDGVFNSYFNGYLGTVEYEGFTLYDFQISANIEDNLIRIREFGNNISNIYGTYDLATEELNFKYHITDTNDRKLGAEENIIADISSIEGEISGDVENIKATSNINKATISLPTGPPLNISGNLEYYEDSLILNELKVNENIVTGNYNLANGLYSFKANLLNENIPEYYGDINLKYRVLGEVYLWGNKDSTKAYARTSLDKVYLRGQQLPNLYIEGSLTGGVPKELAQTGKISLRKISLLDEKREEILEAEADIDLENKRVSAKTNTDALDISKLSYLFDGLTLDGKVDLDFQISGDPTNLVYSGDVESEFFRVGDINLEKLEISLDGDLNGAKLNEFSVEYEGNSLNAEGNINLKELEYYLDVDSSKIDLKFLNVFLGPFGVENIEGMSTIDLTLRNNKNEGSFVVKGLKADIPEYGIEIKDINSNIKLDNEKVFIDEFNGIVNEGTLALNGYLDIPDIKAMQNALDPLSLLNYSLELKMDKVKYNYEDAIELVLSSDAVLKDNKITGDFIIDRGDIKKIPEVSEEDVEDIKDKAIAAGDNAIVASQDLGSDFEIKTRATQGIEADINLVIKEGIFINVEKVAPLVEDLEAVIKGNGNLIVKDSRVQFLGELNTERGAVTLNGNLFEIDVAILLFNNTDEYLPEVDPTVILNARSLIANEEVYITATGRITDLELILSSSSGLSNEDIASLLAFHNTSDSSSSNAVVKNILDSQISRQLFNPVSGEIQRILRISKFKISSDITAYEYQDGEYEESSLGVGASIEAENPIYKNKVFWNASARIADNKEGDSIDEYDFIIEHRFAPSLSWGVGVGKLPDGRISRREDETANLNYHIDFKFRKRYNSITEIFIRK